MTDAKGAYKRFVAFVLDLNSLGEVGLLHKLTTYKTRKTLFHPQCLWNNLDNPCPHNHTTDKRYMIAKRAA